MTRRRRQGGFSLVELVMVLLALGLLAWVVSSAYGGSGERERILALANGKVVQEAVRAFAINNARLPCPDLAGTGWEGGGAGCAAGVQMGWVPYRSLGLEQPADRDRMAYGVYRNAAGVDLTVRVERSGDAASDSNYQDVRDLMRGLQSIATQAVSASYLYLTGDGGPSGAVDCANNRVSHPAFVLIAPLEDRDGNASRLDGVHAGMPAAGVCVQGPATAASAAQDDVVISESLPSLLGWLSARAS